MTIQMIWSAQKKKENLGSSDLLILISNPLLNTYILTHCKYYQKQKKKKIGRHCKNEKENPWKWPLSDLEVILANDKGLAHFEELHSFHFCS